MRWSAVALVVLSLALGCGPDRVAQLSQEIKKIADERVPSEAVVKAKADADASEAALAKRTAELEAARKLLSGLQAKIAGARAAFDREVKRNEDLRAEITKANQDIADAQNRKVELTKQIAAKLERAGYLRDRAATLAGQIRPGDPAWATDRRLETLSQLLTEAARVYPDDPVIARLARTELASSGRPSAGTASAVAGSLRDRLRWVYGLSAAPAGEAVSSGPPGGTPAP